MRRALSTPVALCLSGLLVGAIAVIDRMTGLEIRIYPLYFMPIALGAWYAERRLALLVPAASTVAWAASNLLDVPTRWSTVVWGINTTTQAIAFTTVGILISELRGRLQAEQELSRLDPLTGLNNSRSFHDFGALLVPATARAGRSLTLAYLDLDNFKGVNDTQGHAEGDRVLRAIADVLRSRLRGSDVTARVGGDEFALLLPDCGVEGSRALLEHLREGVIDRMRRERWPVTVSVGAVVYLRAPPTFQAAVKRADALMYAAKKAGKDRVHIEVCDASAAPSEPG